MGKSNLTQHTSLRSRTFKFADMDNIEDYLIEVLQKSIEKHGPDKPITLSHLLNIIKMAREIKAMKDDDAESFLDEIRNEVFQDQYRYGQG
jgi:hypothetical protein